MQQLKRLDPTTCALLVMDYQNAIVGRYISDNDPLLDNTSAAIEAARTAGMLVIYVRVGFRQGYPEVSADNALFSNIGDSGHMLADDLDTQIHQAVAPAPADPVVTKHRVGAFEGTDLAMILGAQNIDTLVMAGIATSGVVLSTLRCAADLDYRLVVLEDCCADKDPEVHRVLIDKIFPHQATITDAGTLVDTLAG